jgi:hypothetical protein
MANPVAVVGDIIDQFTGIKTAPVVLNESELFSIGPVVLHGHEANGPLHITGEQQTAVHDYIGGGRAVQTFGGQPGFIKFNGVLVPQSQFRNAQSRFVYEAELDPIERAQQLDAIRRDGKTVDLIYGPLHWLVVVENFVYDIRYRNEVEYDINLVIVQEVSQPARKRDQRQQTLFQLSSISENVLTLLAQLKESEIYIFLGVTTIAAIEEGDQAAALLATLVASNSVVPSLGLIDKANQLLHAAAVIKFAADAL